MATPVLIAEMVSKSNAEIRKNSSSMTLEGMRLKSRKSSPGSRNDELSLSLPTTYQGDLVLNPRVDKFGVSMTGSPSSESAILLLAPSNPTEAASYGTTRNAHAVAQVSKRLKDIGAESEDTKDPPSVPSS